MISFTILSCPAFALPFPASSTNPFRSPQFLSPRRSPIRFVPRCTAHSSEPPNLAAPVANIKDTNSETIVPPTTRVRALNTRLVIRIAEADIRLATAVLSVPLSSVEANAALSSAQATAQKLKKDLRSLRKFAVEGAVESIATTIVARLQQKLHDVDSAVEMCRAQEYTYSRGGIDELIEGSLKPEEDLQSIADAGLHVEKSKSENSDLVDAFRRSIAESGDTLKRQANSVGQSIEDVVSSFVRQDGSVDVKALRAFTAGWLDNASMTWKRLNGEVPDSSTEEANESSLLPHVSVQSVRDNDKEFRLRDEIGLLEKQLISSSKEREAALRKEDQLGKLIRAKEIRQMDDGVSALRRELAVRVLQLEMETIFVSLSEEIDGCDQDMMNDQQIVVVEFADLDERLSTLELFMDQGEPLLIEDDTLGELAADIQYLKTRLGLDEALYSSVTLSWPQARQFFISSGKKTRDGFEFYSRGLRLYAGDLRFALRLIRRAVTGYTPTSREIRTIRRTMRDLLTLIPFTIVLIAPLTPIGHVLIFSFLQRYWPEFFPSTFSERRQTLMKKHEQYEKSLQRESGAEDSEDVAESDSRKGPLSALFKLVFFGLLRKRNSNDSGEQTKAAENGVDVNGVTYKEYKKEEDVEINGNGEMDAQVSLEDLSKSAQDSEKTAQKKRIALAIEELHLAD